jgi:L-rhamnose isomerase/sugar isomerase
VAEQSTSYRIPAEALADGNDDVRTDHERELEALGESLARRSVDLEDLIERARGFTVAIPSWGVGTGGTRFARFPGPGEPRDVFEKFDDCATVHQLVRCTPTVSLHVPWDRPADPARLRAHAQGLGLGFDAMNSNTFQDIEGQAHSYRHGSLTHVDAAVRRQAIEHNLECIAIGRELGSCALTVWIADGSNFPGQHDLRSALERYLESLRVIYAALPEDWTVYLEHKLYEPAFYATVLNDWGTSYWCARELGSRAKCLVDLGHHAPNTNIEMIVARLAQFGKLGGFHFNDSKYGDDDLDSGSIHPFQLFLVFNELVAAELADPDFAPAYMLDQSHNVTDPLESLMLSAVEVQRAQVQARLVDREALRAFQKSNDALLALETLKAAFRTDVSPILAEARRRNGGALDPVAVYRSSGYRARKGRERPPASGTSSGIV